MTATKTKDDAPRSYRIPVVHARVPESLVDLVLVGGLVGVVAAGVLEAPVAALVAGGLLLARMRHHR
jgi:hypothetical protein